MGMGNGLQHITVSVRMQDLRSLEILPDDVAAILYDFIL